MIPESFDYQRAGSVSEAISLLQQGGEETKILAGGHSLIPTMKLRLATPETLIDIGGIPELKYINDKGDYLAIGPEPRIGRLNRLIWCHKKLRP